MGHAVDRSAARCWRHGAGSTVAGLQRRRWVRACLRRSLSQLARAASRCAKCGHCPSRWAAPSSPDAAQPLVFQKKKNRSRSWRRSRRRRRSRSKSRSRSRTTSRSRSRSRTRSRSSNNNHSSSSDRVGSAGLDGVVHAFVFSPNTFLPASESKQTHGQADCTLHYLEPRA